MLWFVEQILYVNIWMHAICNILTVYMDHKLLYNELSVGLKADFCTSYDLIICLYIMMSTHCLNDNAIFVFQ